MRQIQVGILMLSALSANGCVTASSDPCSTASPAGNTALISFKSTDKCDCCKDDDEGLLGVLLQAGIDAAFDADDDCDCGQHSCKKCR